MLLANGLENPWLSPLHFSNPPPSMVHDTFPAGLWLWIVSGDDAYRSQTRSMYRLKKLPNAAGCWDSRADREVTRSTSPLEPGTQMSAHDFRSTPECCFSLLHTCCAASLGIPLTSCGSLEWVSSLMPSDMPRKSTKLRFAKSPYPAIYVSSTKSQLMSALASSGFLAVGWTNAGPSGVLTTEKSSFPSANQTLAPST